MTHSVEQALAWSDQQSLEARAARVRWLSRCTLPPGHVVAGRADSNHLWIEAKGCYVSGHFIATLLVALAFVEHQLTDLLLARETIPLGSRRLSLETLIAKARSERPYPDAALLDRVDALREVRNPYAHRRPADDKDTLDARYVAQGRHPLSIMEDDAQEALQVMHALLIGGDR